MTTRSSRRDLLKWTSLGAAAALVADRSIAWTAAPEKRGKALEPSVKSYPLELGLASYSFREFKLDQALAMAKRIGLKHICLKSMHLPLESKPEQLAAAAEKAKAMGLDLYGGGVIQMSNSEQVNQAFDYAKGAGMRIIVGVPVPDMLALVQEKVEKYDIRVAIHNHGPGDKTYPTPESAYEKIKDLDKRIGLCIDIGHTLRVGADPVHDAQRFADRLLDIHIKDVTVAAPEGREVEIGRGVIDIPAFLTTLVQSRFAGIVSFEHETDAKDPLPGLAESVGYVRGVLATLSRRPPA